MGTFAQDLKYGIRMLVKSPGFAAVAILTLALGIGANTAIFSVVNGVLLRPLPYQEPQRLVNVYAADLQKGTANDPVSFADFEDWAKQSRTLDLVSCGYWTFNLTGQQIPERIVGARTSGNFFEVLGVRPILGRVYSAIDDQAGKPDLAVLSYGVWQRQFGGDREIVGRTLQLNGVPTTVVAVMPRTFRFPAEDIEIWEPIAGQMEGTPRNSRFFMAVGRLLPGVSFEQAQAEMDTIGRQLARAYPETNSIWGVHLVPVKQDMVAPARTALLLFLGAVGVVFLIACVNVANLFLSRAVGRSKEIAIRATLGASRARLIRQTLTESSLLGLLGGGAGLALGYWGVDVLIAISPSNIPRLAEVTMDGRVLGFTLALSLLTGLVCGLAPALQYSNRAPNEALKEEGRTATATSGSRRVREGLVVSEIALASILLIGAALLTLSFTHVLNVGPGFRADHLLTMHVFMTGPKYFDQQNQKNFVRDALQGIATQPGVLSAGAVSTMPLDDSGSSSTVLFASEGQTVEPGKAPAVNYRLADPNYFSTMGIPLVRGRIFTLQDDKDAPRVVLINQSMARRFWPNDDPVGKRVRWIDQDTDAGWHSIVGVVGDVKTFGLDEEEHPAIYAPYPQRTFPWLRWMTFVARTQSDPGTYSEILRQRLASLDRNQPVYGVRTMDQLLVKTVSQRRFAMFLVGLLAAVGIILAFVGVFGVINYSVSQRSHEIGLRVALGAQRGDVLRLVIGQGLRLIAVGVVAGISVSFIVARFIESMLFGVGPNDPGTFAGVSVLVAGVALLACYVPVRRALRVDPMIVLRYE
jgi:putative ABC transport system permease protein